MSFFIWTIFVHEATIKEHNFLIPKIYNLSLFVQNIFDILGSKYSKNNSKSKSE